MQFFVVAHRRPEFAQAAFAPYIPGEALHTLRLLRDGEVRAVHTRTDERGAILVIESESRAAVDRTLAALPLAGRGMLSFDVYETKPYLGLRVLLDELGRREDGDLRPDVPAERSNGPAGDLVEARQRMTDLQRVAGRVSGAGLILLAIWATARGLGWL